MSEKNHLSVISAILVSINIMMGAGIFINTIELSKRAGALSFTSYLLIGLLVLPLVFSLAHLVTKHPSGGFYIYGAKELHPFIGFFSAWSYFVGKLASAALMIHASVLLLQQLSPSLLMVHPFVLDITLLTIFTLLNTLNVRTGGHIQATILGLKLIPVGFVMLAAAFLARAANLNGAHLIWSGLPSTIPLALYAASGFEAACSLSGRIKNAQTNAPIAIITSYTIVIFLIATYQLCFYLSLGSYASAIGSYLNVFPALTTALFSTSTLSPILGALFNSAIAFSALGGGYGILYSNNWNLYTLAQHKHTFFANALTQLNMHHIPVLCVIIEMLICISYLLITGGRAVLLQQVSALAGVCAYTCSVLALLKICIYDRVSIQNWLIALLGLISCLVLGFLCIKNMILSDRTGLIFFSILILFGAIMFIIQSCFKSAHE